MMIFRMSNSLVDIGPGGQHDHHRPPLDKAALPDG
jgi:hypothetical protein